MIRASNKYLFNFRLNRQGGGPNSLSIDRDLAISKNFKSQFFGRTIENVAAFFAQSYLARKENGSHAIPAVGRQMKTQPNRFVKEKFMRYLYQDARSITRVSFTPTGTTMLHILKNSECICNMLVRFVTFNIGNKTDTAGIVFKRRVI